MNHHDYSIRSQSIDCLCMCVFVHPHRSHPKPTKRNFGANATLTKWCSPPPSPSPGAPAKKGFYKGKGAVSPGVRTAKGRFVVVDYKRPDYIVPPGLASTALKPYVERGTSTTK